MFSQLFTTWSHRRYTEADNQLWSKTYGRFCKVRWVRIEQAELNQTKLFTKYLPTHFAQNSLLCLRCLSHGLTKCIYQYPKQRKTGVRDLPVSRQQWRTVIRSGPSLAAGSFAAILRAGERGPGWGWRARVRRRAREKLSLALERAVKLLAGYSTLCRSLFLSFF